MQVSVSGALVHNGLQSSSLCRDEPNHRNMFCKMTNFVVADYTSQPVAIQSRIVQLISLLQQDSDNIACYIQQYGIPEVAGLRAQVWSRCIARYFTSPCYTVSSSSYWDLIAKYYRYPNQHLLETRAADNDSNHTSSYDDISVDDHPLNPSNDSIWQQYFSDQHLLRRIRMDTVRTHPDWHVFRQREPCMNRILFLFAKLHPELGYIQGMNELAAPFVYVYLWDGSVDWEPRREGGK